MIKIRLENGVVITTESEHVVIEGRDEERRDVMRSDEYDARIMRVVRAAIRAEEVRDAIRAIADSLEDISTWDSVCPHAQSFLAAEVKKLRAL